MEKVFNKLVRDNIPNIIKGNNETPITRILNDEEYKIELLKKLKEECNEVIEAKNTKDVLEELADTYEVLKAIATLLNSSIDQVANIANEKAIKRGAFNDRIFLERTYDNKENI